MLAEDRKYLEDLETAIWDHRSEGRSSRSYSVEKRSLTDDECARVVKMLSKYSKELVFEPGGGVFGFGVSMSVYFPPIYPGTPCSFLICLTDKHVFGKDFKDKAETYAFVEQFTHTEGNKRIRTFCGFKEPLRKIGSYDY